jgi:hypothetical protein
MSALGQKRTKRARPNDRVCPLYPQERTSFKSFPSPTLSERRHRSLARLSVAVGRRAIFVLPEGERPHPRRANWPGIGFEDTANDNAIGEHVEVIAPKAKFIAF